MCVLLFWLYSNFSILFFGIKQGLKCASLLGIYGTTRKSLDASHEMRKKKRMKEDEHTQFWVEHAVFWSQKKHFPSYVSFIYESSPEKNLIFYGVKRITKCLCASLTLIKYNKDISRTWFCVSFFLHIIIYIYYYTLYFISALDLRGTPSCTCYKFDSLHASL